MKNLIYFLMISAICMACKSKVSNQELHYDEKTLKEVMTDLYIAAEAVKGVDIQKQDSLRMLYKSQIEKIHGVEMSVIETDIENLLKNPKRYHALHQEVKDSVNMWFTRISEQGD